MAPPNPPSRDAEGGGSSSNKTGNVPGRIGRPPQWTSTRSRKLARLYMYTTLSVDKILKVLEDDVFKPRKNSAQKTIHNMLDHDPRYLRPESREDMNQRIRLLSASSQRTRRSKKSRDDDDEAAPENKPQRPSPLHQVNMPVSVPAYGDLGMHPVHVGHVSHVGPDLGQPLGLSHPYQQHPQHPQSQHPHQHQHPQHQNPHQHPQHQHQPQHLPPSTQPPGDYLPPPPHPSRLHEQPYPEFYHPQYQQQQHPQHQQHQHPQHPQHPQHQHPHPLAGGPSYMRSWPDFYAPPVVTSAADVDAATRLAISCAPFELPPHAANHGHGHGHGHPHDHMGGGGGVLTTLDGPSPDDGMHMSLYGQQMPMTRERRPSSAACSTASSDVSTQTIQDLKKRLSGCSTHYANQVANLLRRFTISSGSDDKGSSNGPPVLEADSDPHRVRKQRHRRHVHRPRSSSLSSSSSSSDDGELGSSSCTASDDEEDKKMVDIGIHGFGQTDRPAAPANPPVFLGACGDGVGSPRLALPGDFFNAFRYRNEACPHHRRQNGESGGPGGPGSNAGSITSRRRDRHKTRERRYWCAVADAVTAAARDGGSFWVLGDGRLAPEAQALLHETSAVPHAHHPHQQLTRRDRFGHTLLHLFAAREGAQMQLLAMVLNSDDASLVAANTAGQTFLHLLAPGWFVGLHEPYAPLLQLLSHLRERQPPDSGSNNGGGPPSLDGSAISDGHSPAASTPGAPVSPAQLVYATDVYGRSFFHRLQTFVDDPNVLAALAQPYDRGALSRRDAFNNVPLQAVPGGGPSSAVMLDDLLPWQPSPPAQTSQSPTPPPGGSATVSPADADMDEEIVFSSEDAFIRHHESLLRIVTASDSHPGVEDAEGRNGLHCLAQAIVDKRMMDEHRNAISTGRRPPKKKTMDKKSTGGGSATGAAGDLLSPTTTASTPGLFLGSPGMGGHLSPFSPGVPMALGHGSSGSAFAHPLAHAHGQGQFPPSSPSASLLHTSADGPQMATRLRLVQGLLSAPTAVDVNHYDRRGQTVLTSFVVHIPDDQEDKAKSLAAILETLLAAGARIDGRNRRGETALLVAARLGRKIALTTLLDHGANVHVRDAAGHGVLDIIDAQCRQRARHDVALYGRLEACRVLLTSIKQLPLGVRQRPSLLDEWSVASRRGPEPRDLSMVM